ncbi:hypothetical protein NicSoilB8_45820 (plasmid) [Arthrobacter sp. NicSoilB8]|nr:hypothetical protein NicSoilB8_45820 [Arthrobacter sp. NicSoilB8]
MLNYLRVVADDRRPDAYAELMRVAARTSDTDTETQAFESRLRRHLRDARAVVRTQNFDRTLFTSWKPLITEYLRFVPRPLLNALSPAYQQGNRLDQVLNNAIAAFERELTVDGDPVAALNRLSEEDAIRLLTIHKCKGLEFENVIVLGVETDVFSGNLRMLSQSSSSQSRERRKSWS